MLTFENAFVTSGFITTAYVLYHLIFDRDINDNIEQQVESAENVLNDRTEENDFKNTEIQNRDHEDIKHEPPICPDFEQLVTPECQPEIAPVSEPVTELESNTTIDIPPDGDVKSPDEIQTCDDTSVKDGESPEERRTWLVMSPNYIYRFHKNPRPLLDGSLTPENEAMTSSEKNRIREEIISTLSDPFPQGSSAPVVSSEEARYIPVQYSGLRKKRRCGRLRDFFRFFTFSRDCLPLFTCCKKGEE